MSWKPKHLFRGTSLVAGLVLLGIGLYDGRTNFFCYLDTEWLIGGGVVLVALAARKHLPSVGGQ